MIFVTTGTTNFSFKRMDDLVHKLAVKFPGEKIIYQSLSTVLKSNSNLVVFPESEYGNFINFIKKARVIITHGGPATIFQIFENSRVQPIVVPRSGKLKEHINNHQVHFATFLEKQNRATIYYPEGSFSKILKYIDNPRQNKSILNADTRELAGRLSSYVKSGHPVPQLGK